MLAGWGGAAVLLIRAAPASTILGAVHPNEAAARRATGGASARAARGTRRRSMGVGSKTSRAATKSHTNRTSSFFKGAQSEDREVKLTHLGG